MSEHQEQVAFIQWCRISQNRYHGLDTIFAIPNGGKRHIGAARKLRAEGVLAGVPDLMLPVAKGLYHGLFIELKFGKNKPTSNQIEFMQKVEKHGFRCAVCYNAGEAIEVIKEYYHID